MFGPEPWMKIAREDLAVAKLLLKQGFFAIVLYHCQQSGEKSLKAYLDFYDREVLKTHDLVKLVELCYCIDKKFEKLYVAAVDLNPYATRFRYPAEAEIPDEDDAKLAVKYAQQIMTFVTKKLSEPKCEQLNIGSLKESSIK